jgi:hypothetical protein
MRAFIHLQIEIGSDFLQFRIIQVCPDERGVPFTQIWQLGKRFMRFNLGKLFMYRVLTIPLAQSPR